MIYLDNAATTEIHTEVLVSMMPYLTGQYGNPGALYSLGRDAKKAVEDARVRVSKLLGCDPWQVVFTSSGSEANSMVFHGLKSFLKDVERTHILVSEIEHHSILDAAASLRKDGFDIGLIPVKENGEVDVEAFRSMIAPDTGLVSVMYVNNEIGSVNPIEEIGDICREHGVLFHTDCVQAAGAFGIDVKKIGCDFATISAHKLHSQKGVGALYIRNRDEMLKGHFQRLIFGGSDQEFGLRGGTENVPGIVGFGRACQLAKSRWGSIHSAAAKQTFYAHLNDILNKKDLGHIIHENADSFSNFGKILNFRVDGVDAQSLILMLDTLGVCVSAGSACQSHEIDVSHVLKAIGLSDEEARSSVRVSFSILNTIEEAERAAEIFASCIEEIYRYTQDGESNANDTLPEE